MSKAKIKRLVQTLAKINFKNKKRPELARAISKETLDDFIASEKSTREDLIDHYQTELEEDPEQTHLQTFIEMLKAYV